MADDGVNGSSRKTFMQIATNGGGTVTYRAIVIVALSILSFFGKHIVDQQDATTQAVQQIGIALQKVDDTTTSNSARLDRLEPRVDRIEGRLYWSKGQQPPRE